MHVLYTLTPSPAPDWLPYLEHVRDNSDIAVVMVTVLCGVVIACTIALIISHFFSRT